jgi:hypothetical protein
MTSPLGWHDDSFQQQVPAGRWEHLTWQMSQPGYFNEAGLKLPDGGSLEALCRPGRNPAVAKNA